MSADIERSSGTPALGRDDARLLASVARALTPDVRDRPQWSENMDFKPPTTQGDIFDTAPRDCAYWSWWWSKRNGEVGFARRPCRNRTCPTCGPRYVAEHVAPAVKVWGTRARRAEFQSHRQWRRKRESLGLLMRGERADSGLLVIRHGEAAVVWCPVHVGLDGVVLSGARLREQLVADVRLIPLPDWKPPKPRDPDRALAPIGAARQPEYIEWNAQAAGIALTTGKRPYGTAAADEEQGRRFVELMRSR